MAAPWERCAAHSPNLQWSAQVRVTIGLLLCLLTPDGRSLNCQVAKSVGSKPNVTRQTFGGYDVISVKPNVSGSGSMSISTRETTFQATNISLRMMLKNAYSIRDGLIFGLPKWAESTRWDINAKVLEATPIDSHLSNEASTELYRVRVRSILADRFHLRAHTETKILPIYDLVLLPGPMRFQESKEPEDKRGNMDTHNREMNATGIPLKSLADFLSNIVDRTVIDKTGLTGEYDLTLKWSPDELAEAAKETGATDRPPEIQTALQEELGLKLVSGKGPSQTLVVDVIEPPADN